MTSVFYFEGNEHMGHASWNLCGGYVAAYAAAASMLQGNNNANQINISNNQV